MDYKFEFFNSVDPSKIQCRIRDKFAKLCLSSGKKKDKSENQEGIRRDEVRRSLNYLLTDDESDKENSEICGKLESLNLNTPKIKESSKKDRRRTSFYSTKSEIENEKSSESVIEIEDDSESEGSSSSSSVVVLSSESEHSEEEFDLPLTTEDTKAKLLESFLEDVAEQIKGITPYDDTVSMHESFVCPVESTFHPKLLTPEKVTHKHALLDTVVDSLINSQIIDDEEKKSDLTIEETTPSLTSAVKLSTKSTMKRASSNSSRTSSSTEVISTTVNFKMRMNGAISARFNLESSDEECSSQSSKRLKSSDGSAKDIQRTTKFRSRKLPSSDDEDSQSSKRAKSSNESSQSISNLQKTNAEIVKTHRQSGEKKKQSLLPEESMLGEFSIFHRAIPKDLESTRLTNDFKKPASRPSKSKQSIQKPSSSKKNDGNSKKKDQQKLAALIDTSDDEEYEIVRRRPRGKSSRKPILDDTLVEEAPNHTRESDALFNEKLKRLFNTSASENKVNTPTPSKVKRKLWTPSHLINNNEQNLVVNSPKPYMSSDEEILIGDDQKVSFNGNPLVFPNLIKNKKIDSKKTGKPIFKLPTAKSSTKKKENKKMEESNKGKENIKPKSSKKNTSPQTPKPLKKISIEKISNTPNEKYSFLKSLGDSIPISKCHPDALIYKNNFKEMKEELAKKLYDLYNEKCFKNKLDVPITWNKKLTNTAGRCANKRRGTVRLCAIDLSDKVLSTTDRLRCTLIHELCHAATWIFDEEHGHGATWKAWALKANTTFPELPKIDICHQYEIEYKYTYRCTKCNAKADAHSKSKKVENIRCAKCHGKIEILHNKKDKEGNVVPTPVREAKGFAKFVREKYKEYKTPAMKHSDVMKILSGVFAEMSLEEKNLYNL